MKFIKQEIFFRREKPEDILKKKKKSVHNYGKFKSTKQDPNYSSAASLHTGTNLCTPAIKSNS